jgi:hypothetical protein
MRNLNWQRKCLEDDMDDVLRTISGKAFSPARIANFLESMGDAREVTTTPPRYIRDLATYLDASDKQRWQKVKNKRDKGGQQPQEPRTPFSIWLKGEDIDVLAEMEPYEVQQEPTQIANVFHSTSQFEAEYNIQVPSVHGQVRTLAELRVTGDYWGMNREERETVYGCWQAERQEIEAANASVRFAELKSKHATVLSDMDDYRDQVSPLEVRDRMWGCR